MRSDTRRRESKTLWPVLNQGKAGKGHISAEIVRQLSALRDHLNTPFGTPDFPDRAAGPNRQKVVAHSRRAIAGSHRATQPARSAAALADVGAVHKRGSGAKRRGSCERVVV